MRVVTVMEGGVMGRMGRADGGRERRGGGVNRNWGKSREGREEG